MEMQATAIAHPNIAFIKYWGNRDEVQKLPVNDSLSMNLGELFTRTTVRFDPQFRYDRLVLNGHPQSGDTSTRASRFLDQLRRLAGKPYFAHINSENNFPTGVGMASSASAFAALALAGSAALGLSLDEKDLSKLARLGSGSASRSIPGGFVEWRTDPHTGESHAFSIAPPDHWALADLIVILSDQHKPVGSEAGMAKAMTSPLQAARVDDSRRRMDLCRAAILNKDFSALAQITELDSNLMHAVMMTQSPPLFYWEPQSLAIMKAVKAWQAEGLSVTYTLDAGPNVHVICTQSDMEEIRSRLQQFPGVLKVLLALPAGPARLIHGNEGD